MAKKYRFLALSDTHSPLTDWGAFNQVVAAIEAYKPDVIVHIGDALEGDFTSRHARDERHQFGPKQEVEGFVKMAQAINDAAPEAHKVWIYGNHCDNLLNYNPGRKCMDTVELLRSYFDSMVTERGILKGWHVINRYCHETAWRLGQITFRHGADVSAASVKQDLFSYCTPHGLHISGHTHRPHAVTQQEVGKSLTDRWWANTGCLVDMDKMYYMDRARKDLWGHAYVIGECQAPGLNEGRKVYAQKNWDAETVILRRFGENWAPNKVQSLTG